VSTEDDGLPDIAGDSKSSSLSLTNSNLYSKSIAMHLWWADNETSVAEGKPEATEIRQLIPTAALMFKDQSEETKQVSG